MFCYEMNILKTPHITSTQKHILPVDVMHVLVYISDVMLRWEELVEVGNGSLQLNREEGLPGPLLLLLQREEGKKLD